MVMELCKRHVTHTTVNQIRKKNSDRTERLSALKHQISCNLQQPNITDSIIQQLMPVKL